MQRKRIRRTTEMNHVDLVDTRPDASRYISLKHFMAACPASKKDKIHYKNAIHYLLEKKMLNVKAVPRKERVRRYYDREEIPLVRQTLSMHKEGLSLEKAFRMAKQRKMKTSEKQTLLF